MALRSRFTQYWNPILTALRELGGSARLGEVFDWVAEHLRISGEERAVQHRSGGSRFENDIAWARFYLVRGGYLESSRRGVWALTEQGLNAGTLTDDQIRAIIRKTETSTPGIVQLPQTEEQIEDQASKQVEEVTPEDIPRGYRERALEIMQSLPPAGFERLCQRLLRESGFQQVRVTGRSGDGGIDGLGVLQVNAFVSFKILFQCKRWNGAVGSPEVRNFRGAMMGRADKGLILTTGGFTADAQAEAVRDGASPIELVDGQALVTLFEQLQLGLMPRTTYEVDEKFFEEFSQ
jgi:restriction system protein